MSKISRRQFIAQSSCGVLGAVGMSSVAAAKGTDKRPNILFAIADDWSWPHASIHGAGGINTPTFDRVAREGCLFANAFVVAPQCSPNRAAILTGRGIWQLEEAGTHGSHFPDTHPVYPDLLEAAGYHVGFTGKGWGPGSYELGGRTRNPAGPKYNRRKVKRPSARGISRCGYAKNFEDFLVDRPEGAPFCFWCGGHEPHRKYELGTGEKAGKRPGDVTVPPFLPDDPVVRGDMLDYFLEVEWFDAQVGAILKHLEVLGELDNTLVVFTSDNGMPFPRAKANLYEYGTHMPLAIRWPERMPGGQTYEAPVSFVDFAPTFLEAAGLTPPNSMTGRSFLELISGGQGTLREYVLTGRERHTHARFDNLGYPARAIRTAEYLYIRNLKPDRWPAGDPEQFHDIDGSPTKSLILDNQDQFKQYFDWAVAKRPAEELFAIQTDPGCLENLAGNAEFEPVRKELAAKLEAVLKEQEDPRILGTGDVFESYPRMGGMRPELGGFAERGEYNAKYAPKP